MVADYTPHVLVEFGGSPVSYPGEIWACTLRGIMVTGGPDPTDFAADDYLEAVQSVLLTWWLDAANHTSANFYLKWIKANAIGADGKYINPVTHVYDYASPEPGSTAESNFAGFCTYAYTWETGIARGLAHRGRMYLPNAYPLVGGFETSASTTAIAQSGSLLLSALDNQASGVSTQELVFGIYSRKSAAHHDIIGCSADSVVDVQRRRKNRIAGTRSPIYPYAHP